MKIDNDKLFDELIGSEEPESNEVDIAKIVEEKIVSSLEKFREDFDKKIEALSQRSDEATPDTDDNIDKSTDNSNNESEDNENDEL